MNKTLVLFLLLGHFVFAEDPFVPVAVTNAEKAVFKVINRYGSGSGFFVRDNKTFVTALNSIMGIFAGADSFSDEFGIFVLANGKKLKVTEVQSMSLLHNQVVLTVEGYEGPFLELSDAPVSDNDKFYMLGFLLNDENINMIKGRINPPLPGLDLYYVGTSNKANVVNNLTGMLGGPVLDENGQVAGVFEYSIYDKYSDVYVVFVQKLYADLLKKSGITSPVVAGRRFQKELDALNQSSRAQDVSALYRMGRILNVFDTIRVVPAQSLLSTGYYVELAAYEGHIIAQLVLLEMWISGSKSFSESGLHWNVLLKRFSKQGNPYVQTILGRAMLSGELEDVSKSVDQAQAMSLLEQAAEKGSISAQLALFRIYRDGFMKGAPSGQDQLDLWFNELLRRGYVENDFFNLAFGMYYGTGGVAENKNAGELILQQLAEAGEYRSRALLMAEGGMPQDASQAFALLGEAQEAMANRDTQAMTTRADASKTQDKKQALLIIEEIFKKNNGKKNFFRTLSPTDSCEGTLFN